MAEPTPHQKLARELAADHAALLAERMRITDALDRLLAKRARGVCKTFIYESLSN